MIENTINQDSFDHGESLPSKKQVCIKKEVEDTARKGVDGRSDFVGNHCYLRKDNENAYALCGIW